MPRRKSEPVIVNLDVEAETPRAYKLSDGERGFWVAKSLISNLDQLDPDIGDNLDFEIPEWLAKKEGLI